MEADKRDDALHLNDLKPPNPANQLGKEAHEGR